MKRERVKGKKNTTVSRTKKMFCVDRFIDLTGFEGDRADYLVGLIQASPYPDIVIFVNKEGSEWVTCVGSGVRGVSIPGLMEDPAVKNMMSNSHSKEDISAFIRGYLSKTSQTIFKTYSDKLQNQWMTSVKTDVIDWEKTMSYVDRFFPDRIQIQSGNDDDKTIILKIDNVEYRVRVDSMGLRPTDDEVLKCEEHLLSLFSK